MTKLDRLAWLPLVLGCAAAPHAPRAEATPAVDLVVVERDATGDAWLATWRLAEPARELRFERPAGGFRGTVFVHADESAAARNVDVECVAALPARPEYLRIQAR